MGLVGKKLAVQNTSNPQYNTHSSHFLVFPLALFIHTHNKGKNRISKFTLFTFFFLKQRSPMLSDRRITKSTNCRSIAQSSCAAEQKAFRQLPAVPGAMTIDYRTIVCSVSNFHCADDGNLCTVFWGVCKYLCKPI